MIKKGSSSGKAESNSINNSSGPGPSLSLQAEETGYKVVNNGGLSNTQGQADKANDSGKSREGLIGHPVFQPIPSGLTYLDACAKGMSEFKRHVPWLDGQSGSNVNIITILITDDH